MKINKWLIISIILIIIIWSLGTFIFLKNTKNPLETHTKNKNQEKKIYEHTFAHRISENQYFKAEFISNDVASIYPRRDAIVQDILVDIWDEVQAWDTLAILLRPWVEWESQSKIQIKNALLQSKKNILTDAQEVKNAKILEIDEKIKQKEILLSETMKNFDSKLSQLWDISSQAGEYQVAVKELETLEKNLENAKNTQEKLIKQSEQNISQKQELLAAKIEEIYNKIIPILYVWNQDEINYREISSYDFSDQFSAKDSMIKNTLVSELKSFHNWFSHNQVLDNYTQLLQIHTILIQALQHTIISVDTPESIIQSHINDVNIFQSQLISQKEIYDDALTQKDILIVSQTEKIENIQLQIQKKQQQLELLWTKFLSIESEKSLNISQIQTEIESLKATKNLIIANENKVITGIQNDISVAQAELNSQNISSWDYRIISPFWWIISKRNIEVWQKVSANIQAFRISAIQTSLSQITKNEVKFYVPQHLADSVQIWKEIYFSQPDGNTTYTGSIYRISPEIDEQNLSVTVQAKVDENILLPHNTTLRVQLSTTQDIFKVPSATIYDKQERKIMYYKKPNGKLWVKDVTIISEDGEYSLVTGDFDETLKIVTTPIFIK